MPKKELILSITKKDFEVQTFRAGGKGGQHQNKTSSAVRIIHKDSGAVGESREERSQFQNKRIAFKRLTGSVKFKKWLNIKLLEIERGKTIEKQVDEMMQPENLKIETHSTNGWEEI